MLAVSEIHLARTRDAGLEAVAILPGLAATAVRMGVAEAPARFLGSQRHLFEQAILPTLSSSARDLDPIAADAETVRRAGSGQRAGKRCSKRSSTPA